MRGHAEKKARKLDQFVVALLVHPNVEAAAHSIGIGIATAWRWLKDPDVIARYREARRDAMRHTMVRLQEAARESVECLCEVQRTGESEGARVGAARTILEMALKAGAIEDVNMHMDNIEAIVRQKGHKDDRQKHTCSCSDWRQP
jgi:hypothetical protein